MTLIGGNAENPTYQPKQSLSGKQKHPQESQTSNTNVNDGKGGSDIEGGTSGYPGRVARKTEENRNRPQARNNINPKYRNRNQLRDQE